MLTKSEHRERVESLAGTLAGIDQKFERTDRRFDQIDQRFVHIEVTLESHLASIRQVPEGPGWSR